MKTFELEIMDLYKNPEAASDQQIIFSLSLVKQLPSFADKVKVIMGLGITIK